MNALWARLFEQLLLPPGVILTLLGIDLGLLGLSRRTTPTPGRLRALRILLPATLFLTYAASIPVVAHAIADLLEPPGGIQPLTSEQLHRTDARAIVIFGYGRLRHAPEYDHADTLSPGGLARVRYGARLHRLTGLPILVAGGRPYGETISEAELMRKTLEEEFNTPVEWLDHDSRNTWENAVNAAAILRRAGIDHALLVIHARDLSRALLSFRRAAGDTLRITPAPTLFRQRPQNGTALDPQTLLNWIPNADALGLTAVGLHELAGALWYRLRH